MTKNTKKIISILQDLFARKCFFSGSHIFWGELKTEKVRKKFIFFCPFIQLNGLNQNGNVLDVAPVKEKKIKINQRLEHWT